MPIVPPKRKLLHKPFETKMPVTIEAQLSKKKLVTYKDEHIVSEGIIEGLKQVDFEF